MRRRHPVQLSSYESVVDRQSRLYLDKYQCSGNQRLLRCCIRPGHPGPKEEWSIGSPGKQPGSSAEPTLLKQQPSRPFCAYQNIGHAIIWPNPAMDFPEASADHPCLTSEVRMRSNTTVSPDPHEGRRRINNIPRIMHGITKEWSQQLQ